MTRYGLFGGTQDDWKDAVVAVAGMRGQPLLYTWLPTCALEEAWCSLALLLPDQAQAEQLAVQLQCWRTASEYISWAHEQVSAALVLPSYPHPSSLSSCVCPRVDLPVCFSCLGGGGEGLRHT